MLGCELVSEIGGSFTSGIITETEAYWAPDDRASHAFGNRRTNRTEVFFAAPGTAYVYLCYGIHELFNVITGPIDTPHAVLIRALQPRRGQAAMLQRRGLAAVKPQLTSGPGVLSRALGITRDHNGIDLLDPASPLQLLPPPAAPIDPAAIVATPRIGINSAGPPWVDKPWRYYLSGTAYVSRLPKKSRSSQL